jgi:hypothetical protein
MNLDVVEQQFEEQGYTILSGLLSQRVLDGVRAELERWVEAQALLLQGDNSVGEGFADEPFERRLACLFAGNMARAPKSLRPELHWEGHVRVVFLPCRARRRGAAVGCCRDSAVSKLHRAT